MHCHQVKTCTKPNSMSTVFVTIFAGKEGFSRDGTCVERSWTEAGCSNMENSKVQGIFKEYSTLFILLWTSSESHCCFAATISRPKFECKYWVCPWDACDWSASLITPYMAECWAVLEFKQNAASQESPYFGLPWGKSTPNVTQTDFTLAIYGWLERSDALELQLFYLIAFALKCATIITQIYWVYLLVYLWKFHCLLRPSIAQILHTVTVFLRARFGQTFKCCLHLRLISFVL